MFHVKHPPGDTIAAIATPLGEGGVGIVRVSGVDAKAILSHLFVSSNGSGTNSHKMLVGWMVDPSKNVKIDQIMACYMKGPKSYTGEDVVEFYCHGGTAVVQQVLNIVLVSGARLARRGEFTKRAFLNSKLDLSQAEAVLDLVKARTAQCAGYAVSQLEGKLSGIVADLKARVMQVMAGLEAQIDFPDDMPSLDHNALIDQLSSIREEIASLICSAADGKVYREGLATVIVGKPNVGKSCLLNALLGEQRAIVTDQPGTTRDAIEELLNLDGLALRIIDTAGVRHPQDKAEELGVERAEKELLTADFALIVIDASGPLNDLDKKVINKASNVRKVIVLNKVDLGAVVDKCSIGAISGDCPVFEVSALYGHGMDELKRGLSGALRPGLSDGCGSTVTINARHVECLIRADAGLERAVASCNGRMTVDFITIDIKDALLALGEISGELVSEEVINAIFEQFCVGK
ncbi:MAG: tRNA uridine-5-carboxymethylaminomethyl(34) synthesis GTPase MnmE [Candidatus Margulisiibacteriota bacterium]